jgi:3-phenylpropionate/trans-cinnamate dioxygenase ferredoxin component
VVRRFSHGDLVVAIANHRGRFYAFQPLCPHMGGPLWQGSLVRSNIDCPWHHYMFDLATGQNVYPKAVYPEDLAKAVASLRVYPVREANGQLEVGLRSE